MPWPARMTGRCAALMKAAALRICSARPRRCRPVAGQTQLDRVVVELGRRELHVLADVDQHRAGPAGAGDVERFLHRLGQLGHVLDQVVVLRDRQRDAGHVGLLEGIRADEGGSDLAGDRDDRDRVHHGVGQPGDQVRRARARRWPCTRRPGPSPRIAVGREGRVLLVPHEDVVHRIVEQGVIGGHDRAAGIAEDHVDALPHQTFPDDLGASALHGIEPPPSIAARAT